STVFKTAAFDRSATSPDAWLCARQAQKYETWVLSQMVIANFYRSCRGSGKLLRYGRTAPRKKLRTEETAPPRLGAPETSILQ
ncbi:MAG TPA: hypothetical protein VD772_02495, partial [Anseongella sp.]|nr:hypothetical protein [Anseongella sp.]